MSFIYLQGHDSIHWFLKTSELFLGISKRKGKIGMRETYVTFFFWILDIRFWPVIPNERQQRNTISDQFGICGLGSPSLQIYQNLWASFIPPGQKSGLVAERTLMVELNDLRGVHSNWVYGSELRGALQCVAGDPGDLSGPQEGRSLQFCEKCWAWPVWRSNWSCRAKETRV